MVTLQEVFTTLEAEGAPPTEDEKVLYITDIISMLG